MPTTNSSNVYLYSYKWAQRVVEDFLESVSRGTDNLAQIAGISRERIYRYAIHCIRLDHQRAWRTLKIMIKGLERESWEDFSSLSVEMRRKYLTLVKYGVQDLILDDKFEGKWLDKRNSESLSF